MFSQIALEIGIILVLIFINALFAMSEMSIVSARKARLEQYKDEGSRRAATALALAESPNKFLSTVQIGITLVGIFAGAFGGATLARSIAPLLTPWLSEAMAQNMAVLLVVGLITYLSVVFGELVPKRLALQNGESIAMWVAQPMGWLSRLATPVVWLLGVSTDGALRLLGVQEMSDSSVSEEEIRVMIRQSSQAGTIEEAARDMVESIFLLDDWKIGSLMTPRHEVKWVDVDATYDEIRDLLHISPHARLPVCNGDLDEVLGMVHAKDLLTSRLDEQPLELRRILRPTLFVPETSHAYHALERMRQSGIHLAMVIDEYGGIAGLVTLFDMLEAIVGDIPTAAELATPPIVQREDGSWLVDGLLSIHDFKQRFDIDELLPNEGKYQTLGGFIIYMLARLPQTGDKFVWQVWEFEVVDLDNKRVDKLIVTKLEMRDGG